MANISTRAVTTAKSALMSARPASTMRPTAQLSAPPAPQAKNCMLSQAFAKLHVPQDNSTTHTLSDVRLVATAVMSASNPTDKEGAIETQGV